MNYGLITFGVTLPTNLKFPSCFSCLNTREMMGPMMNLLITVDTKKMA